MNIDKILSNYNFFLTGSSGFIGSAILQRLLNVNSSNSRIYCLLRGSSKYATVSERLRNEVLKNEIFEYNDCEIDSIMCSERVVPLEGELTSDLLGLDNKSISRLKYSSSSNNSKGIIVIHCAADIDFNRELNQSININVYGTYQCIEVAKEINANSFIHISTLYVNSRERGDADIEEKIYDQGINMVDVFNKWLKNNQHLDNDYIKQIKSITSKNNTLQMQKWPNSYTFTKNMAENVVGHYCNKYGISSSIIRLGIVSPIHRGKHIGWFMGNGGFVFLVIGIATGNISYLNGDGKGRPDFVPVDYTTDSILGVTANTILKKGNKKNGMSIYQCGVIANNPSWDVNECVQYCRPIFLNDKRIASDSDIGKYLKQDANCHFIQSKILFFFIELILYEIPLILLSIVSYILSIFTFVYWLKIFYDIIGYRYDLKINKINLKSKLYNLTTTEQIRSINMSLINEPYSFVKRTNFMKKARGKLNWFNSNYNYFVNQRWNFKHDNLKRLYNSLDKETQQKYHFDVAEINFNEYAVESAIVCFKKYTKFKKNKKQNTVEIVGSLKNQLDILKLKQQQEFNTLTRDQKLEILQILRKLWLIGGLGPKTSLLIFTMTLLFAFSLFFVF